MAQVYAANNALVSLPDFVGYPNLWNINVELNQLTALPVLPDNLSSLAANNNQLSDVSALAGVTNSLGFLNLEDNHLEDDDAAVIGSLFTLNWLNLRNNAIQDFTPLVSLAAAIQALPGTYQSDEGRPALLALTLTPADILDVSVENNVLVQVDTGTAFSGFVEISSPSGQLFGTGISDAAGADFFFDAFSEQGTWSVNRLDIDGGPYGNWVYNPYAISVMLPAADTQFDVVQN
jgi:hypothetical protein